jgi:hypothetical protein
MAARKAGDMSTATPAPSDRRFSFVVPRSGELRRRVLRASLVLAVILVVVAAGIGVGAAITGGRTHAPLGPTPHAGLGAGAFGRGGEAGSIVVFPGHDVSAVPPAPPASKTTPPPPPSGHGATTPLPPSPPTRIWIPAIGVSSRLIRLGLQPDGSLQVPSDFGVAGWWVGGASPGERGAAVIAGHVDSSGGPAVFYKLRMLEPGDVVWVSREDRADVRFVVQRVERVPKTSFPTRAVYGPQSGAALRLVTCGGAFDRSTGHYVDNIIVFATASR